MRHMGYNEGHRWDKKGAERKCTKAEKKGQCKIPSILAISVAYSWQELGLEKEALKGRSASPHYSQHKGGGHFEILLLLSSFICYFKGSELTTAYFNTESSKGLL